MYKSLAEYNISQMARHSGVSDRTNIINIDTDEERVVTTLTNNWAGAQRQQRQGDMTIHGHWSRLLTIIISGVLPPITHKLSSVVDRFPVIPPITANRQSSRASARSSVSAEDTGGETPGGVMRDSGGDTSTKSRNRHLLKVYMVSLCQLLVVLAMVVCFTGVKSVREVHQQNPWIGVMAIGWHHD